ncbi:hypothetical protein [Bizionia paragorgiae]|uniref:hypothetical protein n=1 Tax=Bizionia paragorgiae TaxID=283786 RepID=UPI00299DF78C|nr:hypothetical protein [Bizionia paragorgiae]MDX1270395.1 hypothetical protein [Bizionia paragorgiae]
MKIINNSLGFCELTFYEHYVISVVHEGVNLTTELSLKITAVILDFYNGKPFTYITHRKHSYSLDPLIYNNTSKVDNLLAFAVVTHNYYNEQNTEVERLFLKKPYMVFPTLLGAKNWATIVFKKHLLKTTT